MLASISQCSEGDRGQGGDAASVIMAAAAGAASSTPALLSPAAMANARHIARFAARPYPTPQRDGAVTRAFEAGAFTKLAYQLASNDANVRARAVVAAREELVDPLRHVQCVAARVTPAIVALLQDSNAATRRDAALALAVLARRELGARDALQHGALPPVLDLVAPGSGGGSGSTTSSSDGSQQPGDVHDAAYEALAALATHECGRAALAAHRGALVALLACAEREEAAPARAAAALGVLVAVAGMRGGGESAAVGQLVHGAGAVAKLAALLDGARPAAVRRPAAKLLAALCSTRAEAMTQVGPHWNEAKGATCGGALWVPILPPPPPHAQSTHHHTPHCPYARACRRSPAAACPACSR